MRGVFEKRLFRQPRADPHEFGPLEPLCQMHVVCESQRRCCEFFFGALKLLCASAVLVSHLVPILIVDLE